ncbi:MAG: AAA family ATPase, partial [Paludibacteraceae bacterium]|nr:AAA family ATPase [Paludibacteraceae bacterium]
MKIKKVIISNFRAFKHAEFELDDFNCIIGKNDTGKSTLLAALEWFFNTNKKLDSDDYAIASICPNDCPYDSIISVEVHFVGEDIPLGEKSTDKFIFNHDFKRNDCVCIKKKYMCHPSSLEQQFGYSIKKFPFKQIGKILSDCSVEELVTKIKELDDDANELLSELKSQKENRPKGRGVGQFSHDEETKKTENKLKKNLCDKLYKLYSEKNEQIINDQWLDFDDEEDRLPLDWFYSYMFHIYTSQTPISVYLNSIFTPYNTDKMYDPIKEVKAHTAGKITEILKTNYDIGQIAFKEQERVNIFTEDSLVFKHDTSSINIPLKNRGEG